MRDQQQLEDVEYFSHMDSTITNDARCTREVKFRIATEKGASRKKENLFT
jgi:hypothetical protein